MQNWRLNPMGPAKPGETRRFTGTGPGLDIREAAGRVSAWFWTGTEQVLRYKPGLLAGYPDPLLTPLSLDMKCNLRMDYMVMCKAIMQVNIEEVIYMHPQQQEFHLFKPESQYNVSRVAKMLSKKVLSSRKSLCGLMLTTQVWYGNFKGFLMLISLESSPVHSGLVVFYY